MSDRKRTVSLHGNALTLVGTEVKAGDKAPEATVLDNALGEVKLSSLKGKVLVLAAVPSLDTPVCDVETRRFNTEATKLGQDVRVLTVSMDLPFAQKRWCGAAGVERVQTLSDHRAGEFGQAFGVLIKELRLLARAVFVVDKKGVVTYAEVVPDVATEPAYDKVLAAVKKAV